MVFGSFVLTKDTKIMDGVEKGLNYILDDIDNQYTKDDLLVQQSQLHYLKLKETFQFITKYFLKL